MLSNFRVKKKMGKSGLYASGILKEKSEELLDMKKGNFKGSGFGTLALTNKRFLFLQRALDSSSKGYNVRLEFSLGDIINVTITGLLLKKFNVQIKDNTANNIYNFLCSSNSETKRFAKKLVEAKDEFKEKETKKTNTVIIGQERKDSSNFH